MARISSPFKIHHQKGWLYLGDADELQRLEDILTALDYGIHI